MAANWAFEMSPDPEEDLSLPKRKAIVIDCEMGGSSFGRSELIQLSAIDFFTGDVLINKLVKPSVPIIDWRTKYSGVTEGKMRKAIMDGTSLEGWYSARTALFQFIDTDTILMGHSVNYDLEQLRLIHDQVIDAHILIPRLNGHKHGVAGLSAELCGKQVQKGGSKGHDCLEDSLAARELIIWALKNGETFIARSKLSSIQEAQRKEEARQREEARQLKALEKAEAQRIQDTEGSGEINHEEEKQHQVQSGGMGVAGLRR